MKLFLVCLLLAGTAAAHEKKYHGDQVVRVNPKSEDHHEWMVKLRQESHPHQYDFWTEPVAAGVPVDLHVSADEMKHFHGHCWQRKLNYTVLVPDLQKLIDEQEGPMRRRQKRETSRKDIVGTFARYNDIVAWLKSMCSKYSSLARCDTYGKSYEKRDLHYIELGTAGSKKNEIFIQAGIHAREWIAPATVIHIINRFLTTYNSDPVAKKMLNTYNFVFVPSANPDGYEYTRRERLWRKTRSKTSSYCYGVDPNRNYDIYWASSGSSSSACSDIYHGPKAFSESETKALSKLLASRFDRTMAYFDVHSYSQMWLIPYANKRGNYAPNYNELLRVGKIGSSALMAVNQKKWKTGNTVEVLSAAAGGSDDWAVSKGVKYSYTLELRPSSSTFNGFVVNEREIDPSGKEVWAGLMAAIPEMKWKRASAVQAPWYQKIFDMLSLLSPSK